MRGDSLSKSGTSNLTHDVLQVRPVMILKLLVRLRQDLAIYFG